jgi:hypothetical protein
VHRFTPIAALLAAGALCGCIPSVHPLYTAQDILFEPGLVGEWTPENSEETWTFSAREGETSYTLVYVDGNGKEGRFETHLFRVGEHLYLDLYPEEPDLQQNDYYKMHLLRVHTFMRVEQVQPFLRLALPDIQWLKKLLDEDPAAVRHEKVGDGVLLTAPTSGLQAFLAKHGQAPGAFREGSKMARPGPARPGSAEQPPDLKETAED